MYVLCIYNYPKHLNPKKMLGLRTNTGFTRARIINLGFCLKTLGFVANPGFPRFAIDFRHLFHGMLALSPRGARVFTLTTVCVAKVDRFQASQHIYINI